MSGAAPGVSIDGGLTGSVVADRQGSGGEVGCAIARSSCGADAGAGLGLLFEAKILLNGLELKGLKGLAARGASGPKAPVDSAGLGSGRWAGLAGAELSLESLLGLLACELVCTWLPKLAGLWAGLSDGLRSGLGSIGLSARMEVGL